MLRASRPSCYPALLLCVLIFFPIQARSDESPEILVSGIGYPPVRAESSAQALFMARRAALLDAYRNALNMENEAEPESERYFQNVAGFLRNVRVVDEAYLDDGAVMLTVAVKNMKTLSSAPPAIISGPGLSAATPRRVSGPTPISLDEWMKIIARLVRFDAPPSSVPSTMEEP